MRFVPVPGLWSSRRCWAGQSSHFHHSGPLPHTWLTPIVWGAWGTLLTLPPPPLHAGANRTAHLQDVGLCLLPCGARVLVLWASVFAECHLTSICVGNIAVLFLKKDNNTGWSTTLVGVCLCVMGDSENLKAVVCAFDGLLGRWWKMTVKYIKWMNKISKQV